MENRGKVVAEKMIEIFELLEKEIRETIKNKEILPEDKFMPGWAKGIHFSWYHHMEKPEYGTKESNKTTCFFEFNGIHVSHHRMEEEVDIDLKFLTTEIFKMILFLQCKVGCKTKWIMNLMVDCTMLPLESL